MPANSSNLDLLTSSVQLNNVVGTSKKTPAIGVNEQGDSFKTVIDRKQNDVGTPEKNRTKRSLSPKKADSVEKTTHKAPEDSDPDDRVAMQTDQDKHANGHHEDNKPHSQPQDESDDANLQTGAAESNHPIAESIPLKPLLASIAATSGDEGGNLLPPIDIPAEKATTDPDSRNSIPLQSVVPENRADLREIIQPVYVTTQNSDVTAAVASPQPASEQINLQTRDHADKLHLTGQKLVNELNVSSGTSKLVTSENTVGDDTDLALKTTVGTDTRIKLTGAENLAQPVEEADADLPVNALNRETAHSANATAANLTKETNRLSQAAVKDVNNIEQVSSQDKVGEKSASNQTTPEPPTQIKLNSPTTDQSWMQQLQTVYNVTNAAKPSVAQLQIPVNFHNSQWFAAMADRVTWLASQNVQAAEIHLDPPELGPMQVRIAVSHDQASVNFVSHQAAVRDMIDSQLLRLKELFANEGLSLIDVNVSDRQQQRDGHAEEHGGGSTLNTELESETPSIIPVSALQHWVDYYV